MSTPEELYQMVQNYIDHPVYCNGWVEIFDLSSKPIRKIPIKELKIEDLKDIKFVHVWDNGNAVWN
jgi:hypothetical protein